MDNPTNPKKRTDGAVKVTVRSRKTTQTQKVVLMAMPPAGIALALVIGYGLLPTALYRTTEQPIQFSHALHVGEDVGMSCEDCHAFRDDGTFVGVPSTESCGECHADPMGDTEGEKALIEKYLKPGLPIPWLIYSRQPDNVFFGHASHVKKGEIGCETCHGDHGKTEKLRPYQVNRLSGYSRDIWGASILGLSKNSWDRMKMDDCVACHRERGVRDSCNMCHK